MNRRAPVRAVCFFTVIAMSLASVGSAEGPETKSVDTKKPVKVYFLSGQSNMCGMGRQESLKPLATSDEKFKYLLDANGNWRVWRDVHYIYYCMDKRVIDGPLTVPGRLGPEVGIGHHLGQYHDEVVLLIKGACGNRSLGWDFMPPTARKRLGKSKDDGGWYAGTSYDRYVGQAKSVLADLKKNLPGYADQGFEMAGFFWWQGHKDKGMAKEKYEEFLCELINDLRADFKAPKANFVVATIGFDGHRLGAWQGVFDAQMAVGDPVQHPEYKGNVASVDIRDIGGGGYHYGSNGATYTKVGDAMGRAMAELLKANKPVEKPKAPPEKAGPEKPRTLSDANAEILGQSLFDSLVALSDKNALKPMPIPIRRAKLELKKVSKDGSMTFLMPKRRTATELKWSDLGTADRANLAVLVTKLTPQDSDAQARAGVYIESLGRLSLAKKFYRQATLTSYKKFVKLLDRNE